MAGTFQGKTSYGGITEYTWTGATDEAVGETITAVEGHYEILEISLHLSSAATQDTLTATKDHAGHASDLDVEFYSQSMVGISSALQRWANNAGVIIPVGSALDIAFTNTDASTWGLSVFVRSE